MPDSNLKTLLKKGFQLSGGSSSEYSFTRRPWSSGRARLPPWICLSMGFGAHRAGTRSSQCEKPGLSPWVCPIPYLAVPQLGTQRSGVAFPLTGE